MTVLEHPFARGHQSLDRDHPEYCDLGADRQRRAYELVREQHKLSVSRIERRNSALSDALHKLPTYAIGDWVGSIIPNLPFVQVVDQVPTTRFSKRSYHCFGPVRLRCWPSAPV